MSEYQAGVCNIGGAEVGRRKQVSYLGGVLYLLFLAFAIVQKFSPFSTLLAVFPAMLFAVGFIQARRKFCFAYGLMGAFNFQKLGSLTQVEEKLSLKADRRTAILIIIQSMGLALVLAAIAMALNLLL